MDLYEQLGIDQSASQHDVKRAYFRLVRQFTPEKDPETFMKIRQAYETLYDEAKRTVYDAGLSRFINAPAAVAQLIMQAEQLGAKNLLIDAVRLLEQSEYSTHNDVQCTLCRLYMGMDKTGKAVKIIDKLLKDNPDNIAYMRLAVEAYMARGWRKKAVDAGISLERIDPGNEENVPALLFNETEGPPYVMGLSVEQIEKTNQKAPLLCAYILRNSLWIVPEGMGFALQQLLFELYDEDERNPWEDSSFAAKKLAEHTMGIAGGKREKIRSLIQNDILTGMFQKDCYDFLPQIDQAIRNIGAEELFQTAGYNVVLAGYNALTAVQSGIPKALAALPMMHAWFQATSINDIPKDEVKSEILLFEIDILINAQRFIPHIKRFQNEFNLFCQYAADFFDMVLQSNSSKIANELRRRIPLALKVDERLTLEWLNEGGSSTEGNEPIHVTKIGRNDPCPCGSGKKYKKCCGA